MTYTNNIEGAPEDPSLMDMIVNSSWRRTKNPFYYSEDDMSDTSFPTLDS